MRPALAIEELTKLKAEATEKNQFVRQDGLESWKARVRAILVGGLGEENNIVKKFDDVQCGLSIVWEGTPDSAWDDAKRRGVKEATELVDAAVYELGLMAGDEPVDEHAFDPELWAHVNVHVDDGDWGKVASQTAIFVESHVRAWAGDPKDANGNSLVGRALWVEVLSETSDYRLGAQAAEREGWRFLGMGFAAALSNVDRHRIQKRDDAKRYALGVFGLGSLLPTQLRYEHEVILKLCLPETLSVQVTRHVRFRAGCLQADRVVGSGAGLARVGR